METISFLNLRALHESMRPEFMKALERTLDASDFVRGSEVTEFESEFAGFSGAPHCISVANGTDALTIVLRAMEIPAGSEVITAANTFVATVEAIVNAGLKPVFVDAEPSTLLLDPKLVEKRITPKTKAVIPVHLYGQMADMEPIQALAKKHSLQILEDAAQAHGARGSHGEHPGQLSQGATFSFFPGKNLGALGDAGAIVTHDRDIATRCSMLRNHGGEIKYTHELQGWNSRLDTLQARFLRIKLRHLADWNAKRRKVAAWYREALASLKEIQLPAERPGVAHSYHLYVIQTDQREALQKHLKAQGVETGIHYPQPVHLLPAFKDLGHRSGDFPVAERAAGRILSLPMCPTLSEEQVARVYRAVREFFSA